MDFGFTESQYKAFEILKSGCNVFLTGKAGTGKSFLVDAFAQWCMSERKELILCAPTGIAAQNVGGATIHRTFNVPVHPIVEDPVSVSDVICCADVILIDEISMCRIDVFDYIYMKKMDLADQKRYMRRKPPIQRVFVGDFFAIAPCY